MGKKDNVIRQLKEEKAELEHDVEFLEKRISELVNRPPEKPEKTKKSSKYAADLSFDFWPPSDWLRLSLKKWKPGRYFQLCIGPLRFEVFES